VARIFLSYAREDEMQVRDVYCRLLEAGFEVWMDKINLLPGQRWQQEIPRALRHSDFILIFFSKHSVSKRGYIQREFQLALETLEEMPPDAIHTIPIRLDDCQIPEQFRPLQWSDLSEAGEFDRIVQALRWGMEQRQAVAPEPALEPPPNPISDKARTFSESEGRSVAETPVQSTHESEPTTASRPENINQNIFENIDAKWIQGDMTQIGHHTVIFPKSPAPGQKSHRVSVITIVSLVIAAVSALAAVIVIPEVRVLIGLDNSPEQRETSMPVSTPQEITNRIGMEFVLIPAGTFTMGSPYPDAYDDEKPAHQVTISEPFYMGKYEVTQAQWKAVMGENPSVFKDDDRPVENVLWEDAQQFIQKLNKREGKEACRLPSEAEWEYAARAGTTTTYSFGDNESQLGDYAWYSQNSDNTTHPVGEKKPNAWGLYDMHGNVWEWVQDWYGPYTAEAVTDPIGPATGTARVIRGGGWGDAAQGARSADRGWAHPGYRDGYLGFRCLSSAPSR
jgi:formylglycine-generating enzyme required for sulfatase activity